jgi:hypothetical protein
MPEVAQLLEWFISGNGRLIAAAALFALMWGAKSLPLVSAHLTTPRRKQAVNALMAMAPAAWLIVQGAPWEEIAGEAILIALAANGINTYRPSKAKPNDDK